MSCFYIYCFHRTRLAQWSSQLSNVGDDKFIQEFHQALVQYFHALGGIVPIFTYMNRFYIEAKLGTDLKTELTRVFSSLVADKHVARLVQLMVSAQSRPFSVPPSTMSTLCKHLYTLNPDYSAIQPALFAAYLPNVGPRMTEEDLQVNVAILHNSSNIFNSRLRLILTDYYKSLYEPRVGDVRRIRYQEREIWRMIRDTMSEDELRDLQQDKDSHVDKFWNILVI